MPQEKESGAEQASLVDKSLPAAIIHAMLPGNPDVPEITQEEIDTSSTADKHLALGDSFRLGIFERPFTADTMEYKPEPDLLEISISEDDGFYYFLLKVDGNTPGLDFPNAHYGVEFDTDFDSRGEFFLWVWGNGSADWVIDDVMLLEDTNGDIGGANAMIPDSSSGDGYDKVLFARDVLDDPESAWQRFTNGQVELAFKKGLVGIPSFFRKDWADNGLADPALFDYNDAFIAQEVGSPACGSDSKYPIKDLNQMDSTRIIPQHKFDTKMQNLPAGRFFSLIPGSISTNG
ncbi:MAG: hypothetical protein PWQ55_2177 [Chloroflexota bacterium]|nr:hypothetical protein [Chloroflexota bacterium]